MALTEEEMAFMNEHLAGSSSPGDSDVVGDRVRFQKKIRLAVRLVPL